MATGLRFIADGGEQFLKTLDKIEKAARKFDKTLESLAKKSDALNRAIRSSGQGFQSTNRALDATIRRFREIDTLLADVARKMPGIAVAIKQGFSGGSLEQFFRQSGVKLAEAFIAGVESELGIRSPSRVMQRIGHDSLSGFVAGIDLGRMAATGTSAAGRFVASFGGAIVSGIRGIAGQVRQAAESALRGVEEAFRRTGQSLQRQGQNLMQGGMRTILAGGVVALATAAPIAIPVRSALEFQNTMTNVQAIIQVSTDQMQALNAEVLALGSRSVAGPQAAAIAFNDIVGGVQDAAQWLPILNASILTAEAGQADLAATTNGLVSVMNSYAASGLSAARASDVYTQTVGFGVGSMEQFVAAMSPLAGLSSTLEISFEELGAGMAYLTAQGASTGQAATRLEASMIALLKPNTQMAAALRTAGFASGEAAIQQLGLAGALDAVYEALGQNTGAFSAALGSTEALQGSVALLNEGYQEFEQAFMETLDGATERARQFQLESVANQVQLFRAGLQGLAITVGDQLLPVISDLIQGITPLVTGLREWIAENPELAGTIIRVGTAVAFAAAGLVTLGGVVAVVSGALSFGLGGALIGVANGFGLIASLLFNPLGVIAGIAGFASGLAAAMPFIGLVVAALAGIGVVISDIKNNVGGAGDAFRGLMQSLRDLFGGVAGLIGDVGRVFQHLFQAAPAVERSFSPVTGVLQTITGLVDGLVQRINTIREFVRFAGGITSVGNEVQRNQEINDLMAERERLVADIAAKEAEIASGTGETQTYLVKQGDTLYDIAARYGTTVEALREANDLQSNILTIGQELVLDVGSVDTSQAKADLQALRDRLKEVDFDLSGLATARELSLGVLSSVRPELDRVREGIGLVKTAFDEFLSGNWAAGFGALKTGFSEAADGIRDVWRAFGEGRGGEAVGAAALAGFGQAGIQVGAGGGLAGAVQSQLNTIASADFSHLEQAIADNMESVIRGAVSIVGIALGGPAGAAIGLANLVATAIENDFLGISTFLDESGIRASVDSALAEVGRVVQEAVSGFSLSGAAVAGGQGVGGALLAGFGQADIQVDTSGAASEGSAITQVISDLVNGLKNAASLFTPEIRESLDQVVSGITGFINNLSGADTSGLDEIVAFILKIGGAIAGAAGFLLMVGIDNLGNIAQNVLPPLGTALSGIITTLSGVGEGDPSKIIEGLGQALGGLKEALSGLTMGMADSALHVIERLTGWELPDAQTGMDAFVGGLQNAWLALQIIADNISRTLHRFFLETRLSILQGIAGILEPIRGELEALGINIFPNLEFELSGIRRELEDFNIDEQIRAAVAQGGLLTATVPVAIAIHPETGEQITRDTAIAEMIASPEQVSRLSVATRQMVEQAVKAGLANEAIDISDARLLLAGAENLQLDFAGLDMTGVVDALLDEAVATGDSTTFTIGMENLVTQGLDVSALQQSVSERIQTALDEGDTETVVDLANLGIVLGVDMDALFAESPIDLGTQAGQALADGLAEANIDLETAGLSAGDAIKTGINTSLGISSPATFGITAGQAIADGLVIGVQNLGGRFNEAVNPIKAKFAEIGIAAGLAGIAMRVAGGVMITALSGVRAVADGVLQHVLQLKSEMLGLGFAVIQDIPGLNAAPPPGGIPGRADGGGITRGMMYEVVEDESEVAVIGGHTYLIPAADGYIIPPRALSVGDVFSPRSGAGASSGGTRIEIRYGDMQINLPQDVGTPDEMRDAVFAAIDEYNKQVTPEEVLRDIE